jgi:hypothetical protein
MTAEELRTRIGWLDEMLKQLHNRQFHIVHRLCVPTGIKYSPECESANTLKGRDRAVPAFDRGLHSTLLPPSRRVAIVGGSPSLDGHRQRHVEHHFGGFIPWV